MTAAVNQVDVARAAWVASGSPELGERSTTDRCARCGRGEVAVTVRATVARTFTDFDRWSAPSGRRLCSGCAWVYRTRALRTGIHRVSTAPTLEVLTPTELARSLQSPTTDSVAIVLPLRPGRKHVIAQARWGHVCIEDLQLRWTSTSVVRLAAMTRLRDAGFTVRELMSPAPAHSTLMTLPATSWAAVFADWDTLGAWRSSPPHWQIGIRAWAREPR